MKIRESFYKARFAMEYIARGLVIIIIPTVHTYILASKHIYSRRTEFRAYTHIEGERADCHGKLVSYI